jgi:flavodoxin
MKKMIIFVFALMIMAVGFAGCGGSKGQTPNNSQLPASAAQTKPTAPTAESSSSNKEGKKALVVYFSLPETTNPNNMTKEEANSTAVINGEVLGNTQYVAYLIQKNTGADIFRIEPKTPYPTDHKTLVDLAKKEQNNKARPELAKKVENLAQYEVIFLGYPNWWADMPMVLYSFLESHNLSGKTIIPFNTHGGSGFSDTINTIALLQPNAKVIKNGYTVSRDTVQNCADGVAAWVKKLNY